MSHAPEPAAALPPPAPLLPTVEMLRHPKQYGPGQPPRAGQAPLGADPWVRALFAFSRAVESPRPPASARADAMPPPYSAADAAPQLANPLAPLRDRDRQALTEIFTHESMAAIEADVVARLSYLVPEPPWEVEPYEFLREFLYSCSPPG